MLSSAKPQGPVGGVRACRSSHPHPKLSASPSAPPARGLACSVFRVPARFLSWGSLISKYRGCPGGGAWVPGLRLLGCGFAPFLWRLFCGCGGFFGAWGGFFGGWGVRLGVVFFVSLSRGWLWLFRSLPVPLGGCRGSLFRVVARLRLVRAGGVACPRVGWSCALWACGCGLPPFRLLALRPSWLLVVGGLVGRFRLRCVARCVGRRWWRARARRPAFPLLVASLVVSLAGARGGCCSPRWGCCASPLSVLLSFGGITYKGGLKGEN